MDLDGNISNVEHFISTCYTYVGDITASKANPKWSESNKDCLLVPDGENGIIITDSSNGRGEDGELVLRFSSTITFDPAVYIFNNTHMLAIAPSGRRNVTDSYVQIQAMFGERAADCDPNDTTCATTQTSSDSNDDSTNSNTNERSQNG